MRISSLRWASLLLLVSVHAGVSGPGPVHAEEDRIQVDVSSAETDFPDGIAFELGAVVQGDVVAVDLIYQMAALETLQLVPADFAQDGDGLTANASVEMEIYFVPAGIDLRFQWLVTFDDEATIETDASSVTWLDDRFEWNRLDGEGVEVFGYETSDDFLELIVNTASEAVANLTGLYQPETVHPIRIWIYETGKDYAGTQAANSQEWSAGSAYPDLQVIHAVIPDGNESEVLRIIPHEISHQILHLATLNPYNAPATWIDEGLAVMAQTGGEDFYEAVIENAFNDDELLSMQGLISTFPFDSSDARLAYAQSFSMMSFIVNEWGDESILRIIEAYADENSHNQVLDISLGLELPELEALWLDWLAGTVGLVAA